MSPYPIQTDRETIIETARRLIERDGEENLSLAQLAAELGIKAPSLYRHIASKNALFQAVVEQTALKLFEAYDKALETAGDSTQAKILQLAAVHRTFAHQNPNTYMLAFAAHPPEIRANPDMLLNRAVALQQIMSQISGEENSLPALRGLLAIIHGFVTLELNGQFQRGGDLAAAYETAIHAYLQGWQ